MTGNLKRAFYAAAAACAVSASAANDPACATEPALAPVVLRALATRLGSVDFRAAAASRGNEEAYAALKSAKPASPRPRLRPDGRPGRPVRSVQPDISSLPRLAANTSVAASGVTSISGFTGIYEGTNAAATGGELEPPDQGLAANAGIIGEIVNNTIQFFQSGMPLSAPLNNAVFFNSGPVAQLSDPHITFDPSVQRWFVDELTYAGPLGYGFFLAVSATDNPLGIWNVYFVPASGSDLRGCRGGCLPDYPQVGYDANAFYISADLFGPSGFVTAAVYALPKSLLVANKSANIVRFTFPDFVVQPAVPAPGEPFSFANGGTEFLMTARNIYNGSNVIRVWQIQNTFNIVSAPETLIAVHKDIRVEPIGDTVASTEPNQVGPYGKSQKATSAPALDGGYNSFSANVKMAGGKLFAALTTGSADSRGLARDIIAYFVVNTNTPTPRLIKQDYIVPPDGYSISFPGLALDHTGNGFIGVTITNPNRKVAGGYPSTAIIPFSPAGGAGAIMVTGVGGATDDGFSGYDGPGRAGIGRWGDFASAVVDAQTGTFYTANEFIPDPAVYPRGSFANWGTYITAIKR